jgi:hypothetical protein
MGCFQRTVSQGLNKGWSPAFVLRVAEPDRWGLEVHGRWTLDMNFWFAHWTWSWSFLSGSASLLVFLIFWSTFGISSIAKRPHPSIAVATPFRAGFHSVIEMEGIVFGTIVCLSSH